ncbi:MAG TPA: hypothetical protein VN922_16755 [Bacteroidia bacterium]|nr:hypothetical protein [Bacteroidia bacterium]
MLISVHVPKTAGTSFRLSLETHFNTSLLQDYNAGPPFNKSAYFRNRLAIEQSLEVSESNYNTIECIHGHFMPIKYLLLGSKQHHIYITWMRNPVDRVISQYYYWKQTYTNDVTAPVQILMNKENWSLERFCLGEEMKNYYNAYYWGFPLHYFSFIGITEFYESDLQYFEKKFMKLQTVPKKENVGEGGGKPYPIDESLRKDIEKHHEIDMMLYKKALEKREKRIQNAVQL